MSLFGALVCASPRPCSADWLGLGRRGLRPVPCARVIYEMATAGFWLGAGRSGSLSARWSHCSRRRRARHWGGDDLPAGMIYRNETASTSSVATLASSVVPRRGLYDWHRRIGYWSVGIADRADDRSCCSCRGACGRAQCRAEPTQRAAGGHSQQSLANGVGGVMSCGVFSTRAHSRARSGLVEQTLAQPDKRAGKQPRHVHLRDADLGRDLRLGHAARRTAAEDPPLALGQARRAAA